MGASVWELTRERLDPRRLQPQLHPDVVIREIQSSRHGAYYMLKSPHAGTYLRLSPRERYLVSLMDGQRSVKDIVAEYFLEYRSLAFNRVIQLVHLLHERRFLTTTPVATYAQVRDKLRAGSIRVRVGRVFDFLMRSEIAVPSIDPFVSAVYRAIGWLIFSPLVLALFAIIAVAGFASFVLANQLASLSIARAFTEGLGTFAIVVVFFAILIFAHELAHALVCKHFGCEVRRGGFTLFFGFPAFFVDTTDIWMESRWRRVAVSAAGSLSDSVVAGAFTLLALAGPPELRAIFLLLAGITYFDIALNLLPLLELDGYYVLVDLLEMPLLRPRAFRFVREGLWHRLRRRERLSLDESILVIYGLVAGAYSLLFFYKSLSYFQAELVRMGTAVVSGHDWLTLPALLLLVVAMGLPLSIRLWRETADAAAKTRRGVRAVATATEHARLRSRVSLLTGIPLLADLPPAQLEQIAAAMRTHRYPAGTAIIRQGERGDRFFVILRGSAEVVQARATSAPTGLAGMVSERVASLGPGDYFGERALLHQAPRAATVRALSDLDALELRADDFTRLVSPTWQLKERLEQAAASRDALASLELFKDLRPSERDLLLTRLASESFPAGEVIIRQGDEGDRVFIVREGEVEVVRERPDQSTEHVATLGPGEFFGELALLRSAPRAVTVRALTTVEVWTLGRQDFDELLLRFLRLGDVFETTGRSRLAALGPSDAAVPA